MGQAGQQKQKKSFEAVYEDYYDCVFRYAYTLLLNREDAEDVTSETFIAAYTHYGGYDPAKASVAVWLIRIAHNRAVNFLRSAASRKRADMPEDFDLSDERADFTHASDASDAVLRLYARLSPEERDFLNLRYVMELKDKEIASLLGLPEKTVNKRYQRLLAKCRSFIETA